MNEILPFLKTFRSTAELEKQSLKMKNKMKFLSEMQDHYKKDIPEIFREGISKIIQMNQAKFQKEAEERLRKPLLKCMDSNDKVDRDIFKGFYDRMREFDYQLSFGEDFLNVKKTMIKLFSDLKDLRPSSKSEIEKQHMALCYLENEIFEYKKAISQVKNFLDDLRNNLPGKIDEEINIENDEDL